MNRWAKNCIKKNKNKKAVVNRYRNPCKNIKNKIAFYYLVIVFVIFHPFKIFKDDLVILF